MWVVVRQLAALLLCTFSLCGGGSIGTPKRYSLKDGRVYSSTSFSHFKAVYESNASSTVQVVVCESFTEYKNASLKAELSFKKQNSSNASSAVADSRGTGFLTQSTDVSEKAQATEQKQNGDTGTKAERTDNRPSDRKTPSADDASSKSKNAVNKSSRRTSKQQSSDNLEMQSNTDATASTNQPRPPGVLDQLQRKTKENDGLKCQSLNKKRTYTLGISYRACKKLLISKQCSSPVAGVYSIALKGIGNFDILVATRVAKAN